MNYDETKQILKVLQVAYPQSFRGMKADDAQLMIQLWAKSFSDIPANLVTIAVESIINSDTREFAPNIGQIKQMIRKLTSKKMIDADEAWEMVYKALCNSIYNSQEEFDKLPAEVKQGVGSPNQLKEWAMMDSSTVNSVISSNFKRNYKIRIDNIQQYESLPTEAKKLIDNGIKLIPYD